MNQIRAIRRRLNITQVELGEGIGVTQSNVSFYERGQTVPPAVAKRLIEFAQTLSIKLQYEDIYGKPELVSPEKEPTDA